MPEQLELFNQPVPETVERLTANQAMSLFEHLYWSRKKVAKQTEKLRRIIVSQWDGKFIDTLGRIDVVNLLSHVARIQFEPGKTYGPSAINKVHMTLTVMFNFYFQCKEDGLGAGYDFRSLKLPTRNPGLLVPRLKEPPRLRFITPYEYRAYYKISRELGLDDIASAIRFGIWAHLAPIDLFGLNDNEIDESAWLIRVYRRHTKTDRNPKGSLQIVHLTEKMWAEINRRRTFRDPKEKKVFLISNRRRKLAKIRKLAIARGYPDFSWRDLRKAGSGYLHKEGVDPQTRADILGHRDSRITEAHYTPPGNPRAQAAAKRVQEAFK